MYLQAANTLKNAIESPDLNEICKGQLSNLLVLISKRYTSIKEEKLTQQEDEDSSFSKLTLKTLSPVEIHELKQLRAWEKHYKEAAGIDYQLPSPQQNNAETQQKQPLVEQTKKPQTADAKRKGSKRTTKILKTEQMALAKLPKLYGKNNTKK